MTENFLVQIFEHNNWANEKIIQACYALSDEQLDAEPHSITKGNIRETLSHLVTSQRGYLADGTTMPESFEEQGEIVWEHIGAVLKSAGMTYDNIVSLRTYLSSPAYDEPNIKLRMKYLGNNQPALTVICCQLLEPKWKLEMEAVAAA